MTKTIVVPLDGSPLAARALAPAAWLACELGADVRLVTATFASDLTDAKAYLERCAGAMNVPGREVGVELVRHHFAGAGIVELVGSLNDAVLCMTTHGRSGLAEILLGSVTDDVLQQVRVPVVLIGPHCIVDQPPSRNLVVAVDGSETSLAVLPLVADWANRLDLDVQAVTVAECGTTGEPDDRRVVANQVVSHAVNQLRSCGIAAHPYVLNSSHPGDAIVAFATGLSAALIAVGTHGRTGLSARALGGVAAHVVRHSAYPVLVRHLPR